MPSPVPQPASSPPPLADSDVSAAPYVAGPGVGSAAADRLVEWLQSCAREPRCSCLVHGVSEWLFELFGRFDGVAFFVLPHDGGAGDRLVEYQAAYEKSWVYKELKQVRNAKPYLSKFGTTIGGALGLFDMWVSSVLGVNVPFASSRGHTDLCDSS